MHSQSVAIANDDIDYDAINKSCAVLDTLISFQTVSGDPLYAPERRRCVNYLSAELESIGFDPKILGTKESPILLATREGTTAGPHVFIYAHYDVQPPGDLDLWKSSPFKAERKNGRIYGRGAQDNKGQLSYILGALSQLNYRSYKSPKVTLLIEGEEESGSGAMIKLLPELKDLKPDLLLICDTFMADPQTPALVVGCRGMVMLEISLLTGTHPNHSGYYGGIVPNAAKELTNLLSQLFDEEGKVVIFETKQLDGANFLKSYGEDLHTPSLERLLQETGALRLLVEKQAEIVEKNFLTPTLEIHSLSSGTLGEGFATQIPNKASAKMSMRLAANQDPGVMLKKLTEYLEQHCPKFANLKIENSVVACPAFATPCNGPYVKLAYEILCTQFGVRPRYILDGGSIPAVAHIASNFCVEPILVGFGLPEDNIHAANESFSLVQLQHGVTFISQMLRRLCD